MNVFGWGPFSSVQTFIAAQRPEKPLPVVTSLTNLKCRISWQVPFDNYQQITRYEILIAGHNGTDFFETTSYCDGSDPATMLQMYCDVPVKTVLRVAPYSLVFDELIQVKVRALNSRLWSDYSEVNVLGLKI